MNRYDIALGKEEAPEIRSVPNPKSAWEPIQNILEQARAVRNREEPGARLIPRPIWNQIQALPEPSRSEILRQVVIDRARALAGLQPSPSPSPGHRNYIPDTINVLLGNNHDMNDEIREYSVKKTVTEEPYIDGNQAIEGLSIYTIKGPEGEEVLTLIDAAGQGYDILKVLEEKDIYDFIKDPDSNEVIFPEED